jgi:glycosyltransferase involved in cell wall biosynthesis
VNLRTIGARLSARRGEAPSSARPDQLTPCMLVPTLDASGQGLTASVLARARLFERHGLRPVVLVSDHQPSLGTAVASLRAAGLLPGTAVVTSFSLGDVTSAPDPGTPVELRKDEPGFVTVPDATSPNVFRCFAADGTPVKYKRYSGDRLVIVDHWDHAMRRTRRDEYDDRGRVVRFQHFSEDTNRAHLEELRRLDGTTSLRTRLDEESGAVREVLGHHPELTRYADVDQARIGWLRAELARLPGPVLFSEHRLKGDPLLLGTGDGVRRVAVVHNNHYNSPYDGSRGVRASFEQLFAQADALDAVVVPTPEQHADLTREFPGVPFRLVPPAPSDLLPEPAARTQDPAGPTVVAPVPLTQRYGLEDCLRAFRTVLAAVPGARLDVYGEGPDRDQLTGLVTELGLDGHVTIRPGRKCTAEVLARAACTLVASDNEGLFQPLVDSLALGTPVVTYDARYGPRDLAGQVRRGLTVSGRGPDALAAALRAVLTDRSLVASAGRRATDARKRLSRTRHEAAWLDVLG